MQYLIDTCVISELLRARPSQAVRAWIDRFLVHARLCAPVYMEIEHGLALMRDDAARADTRAKAERILNRFQSDQWLVFDRASARETAQVLAKAKQAGRPLAVIDAQIVGIAASLRFAVATRDADFNERGVDLVNPWRDAE